MRKAILILLSTVALSGCGLAERNADILMEAGEKKADDLTGDIMANMEKRQQAAEEALDRSEEDAEEEDGILSLDRITKKPFGIKVSPGNSPIRPERFSGYHTGVDFEIRSGEEDDEIEVPAICGGEMILKRYASGYGGAVVQECELGSQKTTVVYGHIGLDSISKQVGDSLSKGEVIGTLGQGYGNETDGERKHLHLGIHKGEDISLLGYVQDRKLLDNWLDPEEILKNEQNKDPLAGNSGQEDR